MRKQIFMAIAEALEKMPDVKFIDIWNNQVEQLSGGALFPTPAIFIEFETLEWTQQNIHTRRGTLGVRLHVVTRAVVTHGFRDPNMKEALKLFDLLESINNMMQNLKGENFTGVMLTASATNHDHAELIESVE